MVNVTWVCFEPTLAIRLEDFDLRSIQVGVFFSLGAISYIVMGIATIAISRRFSSRAMILCSSLMCGIGLLLCGPSNALPESIFLMGAGQILIFGFGMVMCVPIIPEMIEATEKKYPQNKIEIADMASGTFTMFLALG
jgi:MFS family permease